MRSFRKELWFDTPGRRAFLNITPQVEAALKESDVQEAKIKFRRVCSLGSRIAIPLSQVYEGQGQRAGSQRVAKGHIAFPATDRPNNCEA